MESAMNNTPVTATPSTSTSTDPWSLKNPCSGPDHHDFSSSFLQHASGKGISGVCVWAAIFITCHQVLCLRNKRLWEDINDVMFLREDNIPRLVFILLGLISVKVRLKIVKFSGTANRIGDIW